MIFKNRIVLNSQKKTNNDYNKKRIFINRIYKTLKKIEKFSSKARRKGKNLKQE